MRGRQYDICSPRGPQEGLAAAAGVVETGRMNRYGQYCPVAKAMELLDERWTMLVVRELLAGSRHFTELRRGVPRMSPTLLSKRLRTLTRAGIVERHEDGNRVEYVLTPAGEELRPIVEALGEWGVRWIPELSDEDFDPHLLMWDLQRGVGLKAVPDRRTVVQFTLSDITAAPREWWLVLTPTGVDVCDEDPQFGVDIRVEGDVRTLTRVWRGDRSWAEAVRAGSLQLQGPETLRRRLPRWLGLTELAETQTA